MVKLISSFQQKNYSQLQNRNISKIDNTQNSQISFSGIQNITKNKHSIDNYKGCIIGGAIGDALGWPVEFMRLNRIKEKFGNNGITDLVRGFFKKAEITDDTQMTIFTADGLLKSAIKSFDENKLPDMSIIYKSYQNWLATQGFVNKKNNQGWISEIKSLYENRAPGNTCLGSLIKGKPGSIKCPPNTSEGCGGVMRVAPVGLMYYKNPEIAFKIGAECAALTHGHPNAYLAAGVHSSIIANIVQGKSVEDAINISINTLKKYSGHEKVLELLNEAKILAKSDISPELAIKKLGEGWHGDEAIAISTYCILKSPNDFKKALIMAVNHNGDSDSTGAIVGNILGTHLGLDKIPEKWKNSVELTDELQQLATDLFKNPKEIDNAKLRYPTI